MHPFLTGVLRAGIAVAVALGFFGQIVVIPSTAAAEVELFPAYAPFATPYVTVAILGVACVQVALVAVWRLLGMVRQGAIFTGLAFRWVDVVIGAAVVATVLAAGAAAHLAVAEIPSPGDSMDVESALAAAVVAAATGAAFAMLTLVMRGLLRRATELDAEMAGVV
ncbi:DUF2975 domain-containing protein [Streptomyces sp. HNM0574]|uniref:DUF2975 domain-containing protein n=1 Tax=Streptomyces sp. HNM0574 TaxID=2714954 RepID=UPI00146B7E2A|nr:DUF2975 domain-containing protein [Streptomyces sp. HNM0574]NLU68908.1 DUF2975 domain-containing protein [Streptomyces sp. HNM0574]